MNKKARDAAVTGGEAQKKSRQWLPARGENPTRVSPSHYLENVAMKNIATPLGYKDIAPSSNLS